MTSSGSGRRSRSPITSLKPTIVDQLENKSLIGSGSFGHVYSAFLCDRQKKVAVKMFTSKDRASWEHENDIFQKILLKPNHPNILAFIGSDEKDDSRQLYIITDLCEHGSLYDLLNSTNFSLNFPNVLQLCNGFAAGILHLHDKVSIAHRDVKSPNILIKSGYISVIADFGLAVCDSVHGKFDTAPGFDPCVGTKLYRAPEVLNRSIASQINIDAFKCSDVYSLALVMWETVNRFESEGSVTKAYQRPYHDKVSEHPTVEEMLQTVCTNQERPNVDHWTRETSQRFAAIIENCWLSDTVNRFTAVELYEALSTTLH